MRTLLTGERATGQGARVWHHARFESKDADGAWKDFTALVAKDYFISATWGEKVDQQVATATVTLRRQASPTLSLAPLMTTSTLNRNAVAAYAPLLDMGRECRLSTAVLAPGAVPVSGDWREVFTGRIDLVTWDDDPIQIECSDMGAWLMDTQIESEGIYGGVVGVGRAVQLVMQDILDAWPSGKGIPALYTPTAPGWMIEKYTQTEVKVLEALRALSNEQFGWDVRFRYDAAHVSRLTLMDPARSRVTVDATFAKEEYQNISHVAVNLADVRNVGTATYTDSAGVSHTVTAQDAASIAKVGRRFFSLGQNPQIKTGTDATTLINNAVSDMAQPPFDHEVELLYCWFVQLFDRYTFLANGVHYDQDQTLAVVGYQHTIEDGTGKTVLQCAGKITGGYAQWLRRLGGTSGVEELVPEIKAVDVVLTSTTAEVTATGNDAVGSWRIIASLVSQPTLTDTRAATPLVGQNVLGTITVTVPIGGRLYISALAYTGSAGDGNESPILQKSIIREGTGAPGAPRATIAFAADNGLDVDLSLEGAVGSLGSGLQWQYKIGTGAYTALSSAALPQTLNVVKNAKLNKVVRFRVVQADGQEASAVYTVEGFLTSINNTGKLNRDQPFEQGGYAARTTDTSGYNLDGSVTDSRIAPLNSHFRYGTDGPGGVVESATQKFIHGSYIDASRRPTVLRRVTGAEDVSADAVGNSLGVGGPNALVNGGGQEGALGASAPGWGAAGGSALVTASDFAKVGTRSLRFDHSTGATNSYSYQTPSVEAGEVWELSGWIRVTAGSFANRQAILNLDGNSIGLASFTLLSAEAPYTSGPDVGVTLLAVAQEWQFVRTVLRVTASGILNLYLQFGYNGTTDGMAWFDDVRFRKLSPTLADGSMRGRGGFTNETGALVSTAVDSRTAPLNNHFRYGTDGPGGVVETAGQKFVDGAYLDGSRRPTTLRRTTGTEDVTADTLSGAAGVAYDNLISNGGGQDGALGASAPSWTYWNGVNLVPTTSASRMGGRSLMFDHTAGANDSLAYQELFVAAGEVWEASAWIRSNGGTAGTYTMLNLNNASTAAWDVLSTEAPHVDGGQDIGIVNGGLVNFTFVRCLLRITANGLIRIYCQFGYAGNTAGIAHFDGVTFRRLNDTVSIGGKRSWDNFDDARRTVSAVTDSRSAPLNNHFRANVDNVGSMLDGGGYTRTTSAQRNAMLRENGRVFYDIFNEEVAGAAGWNPNGGTRSGGVAGGIATAAAGSVYYQLGGLWSIWSSKIPFNEATLYRVKVRWQQVSLGSGSAPASWFGLRVFDSAGAYLNDAWICANGFAPAASTWYEQTGWMKGRGTIISASAAASDPSTCGGAGYADAAFIVPEFAVNWPGAANDAQIYIDYIEITAFDIDGSVRLYKALTPDAAISATTKVYSNSIARVIAKGYQQATGARDGTTVTFADGGFAGVPFVIVNGGISYEPRNAMWSAGINAALPQYQQLYAQNVTASSCQVRAKLRQKAATTSRTNNFVGTTVTGPGSTGAVTVTNAPSNDNSYTVRARVTVKCNTISFNPNGSRSVVVILESNDGVTGWIERYRTTKTASRTTAGNSSVNFDLAPTATVTGLDSTDQFRWTMLSDTPSGGDVQSQDSTLTPNSGANNDGNPGASYTTSSGDSYASMTPDTDDALTVDAMEVNS